MQTRTQSALEMAANYASAYVIAFVANCIVLPMLGYPVNLKDAGIITFIFTCISIARSYIWRRIFNRLHK